MITRRAAIQIGLGALAAACSSTEPDVRSGHFEVRAVAGNAPLPAGLHPLKLEREALLYIPEQHRGAFALVLHGAGGAPDRIMRRFASQADDFAVALLATKSDGPTWDAIRGYPGTDFLFLRKALRAAFASCTIDPAHLAIAGFSDGASYALSLGIANGDLFSHVIAFSPGFVIPLRRVGKPRIFLSHGTSDPILPIDHASRAIARDLRSAGFSVALREFEGEHTIPPEVVRDAFRWLKS
ncbi:MAG: hypothetical protein M3041_06660 [Acidobacteriota bacterium]|nr:hypothetical protein [Acidobacteriota bacterium]